MELDLEIQFKQEIAVLLLLKIKKIKIGEMTPNVYPLKLIKVRIIKILVQQVTQIKKVK
jgi:hypothetical protein